MASIMTRKPSKHKGTTAVRRKKRLRKLLKERESRRLPAPRR